MRFRKYFKCLLIGTGILLLAGFALDGYLRPGALGRTEIFEGIFLTVEDMPGYNGSEDRLMLVEIHWNTPGVEFHNRAFDYPTNPDDPATPHYRTVFADWALLSEDASVLINTTLFLPDTRKTFLPLYPVRSNETLVVDGEISHVHDHSYLLYWDAAGDAHLQESKPPSVESLQAAVTGIGLQGVPVSNGKARHQAIGGSDKAQARTFIGVDPEKKILYLLAFEKATGRQMVERAIQAGVKFGGQVDGGSSTNLLIGGHAKGIPPHSGIRGWRPIGPYLVIRADPL